MKAVVPLNDQAQPQRLVMWHYRVVLHHMSAFGPKGCLYWLQWKFALSLQFSRSFAAINLVYDNQNEALV